MYFFAVMGAMGSCCCCQCLFVQNSMKSPRSFFRSSDMSASCMAEVNVSRILPQYPLSPSILGNVKVLQEWPDQKESAV